MGQISFPQIKQRGDKISHVRAFTGVPHLPAHQGEFSTDPPSLPSSVQEDPGWGDADPNKQREKRAGPAARDSVIQHNTRTRTRNTGVGSRGQVLATKHLQEVRATRRGREQKPCQNNGSGLCPCWSREKKQNLVLVLLEWATWVVAEMRPPCTSVLLESGLTRSQSTKTCERPQPTQLGELALKWLRCWRKGTGPPGGNKAAI